MKLCRYCNNSFPEKDFGVAKTTAHKVYRRRKCLFCYRKTKNALKSSRRDWIDEYKAAHGCARCGLKDARVLDFHHEDMTTKEFAVSDFHYHQYNMDKVKEEIAKCMVVCANCHRILHHEHRQNNANA